MRSIRTQLVLWLVGGIVVLTILAGVGLYEYMEEVLEHGLDAALAVKAEAIAGAVHMEDDGKPHLQATASAAAAPPHHEGTFYFEIFRADGSMVARVMPAGSEAAKLPRLRNPRKRFADARLPDGTWGRMTELSFIARPDEDEFDPPTAKSPPSPEQLVVVVAHDRRSVDGPLTVLLSGLLLAAVLVIGGVVIIVPWRVRQGLNPLASLSELADKIGPDSLDVRFPGKGELPPELSTIGSKLNELLERLQGGFARERRISAAVAHELRTPIAELQSLCEVTLRWPDDRDASGKSLGEALNIAKEMHAIVENLMALARCQQGIEQPKWESVNLASAVNESWLAIHRNSTDSNEIPNIDINPQWMVNLDRRMLDVVLRNLLSNLIAYTSSGGDYRIHAESVNGLIRLHIGNTTTSLQPSDLPHLSEAFWRKDAARTGGTHAGLGLAIVDAYCRAANMPIGFSIVEDWFEVTLDLRESVQISGEDPAVS